MLERAEAAYRSGDLTGCRDLLHAALEQQLADASGLRLLVTASLELNDVDEAAAALGRIVELVPDDTRARVDLAHVRFALGEHDEAVRQLQDVLDLSPGDPEAVRSLATMQDAIGRPEQALTTLQALLQDDPAPVPALLHAADLHLALGQYDDAVATFRRLLATDDEPGHEVHAYHGMIEAEAGADRWRNVLDRAIDATAVDRHQLTTDLLVFASTRLFGPSEDRSAPPWDDLEQRLQNERAHHRRVHDEELAG